MKNLIFVSICLILAISVNTALGLPGSGTQEEPWRIESLADFNEFAADANYWDDYTRLETDVNLAGQTYSTAVIAPDAYSWNDDFEGPAFTGVFDGNGCKIIALTIDDEGAGNDFLGLFGFIDGGQVRNLGLEGGSVSGTGDCVGGLVGENSGILSNCYSTGDVSGVRYVGGVVGFNSDGVSNCYSTGDVRGSEHTGHSVGGLVGRNAGSVSNCYSTGDVDGHGSVGGLLGDGYDSVSNCYSTGDVSGDYAVGGLVGNNHGSISNCYSTGDVSGDRYVGGLVGWNYPGIVSNCFWDIDTQTHGVTESIGRNDGTVTNVEGLPTADMQMQDTFTSASWDFISEPANGTSETWQMPAGGGYPVLGFFEGDIPVPLAGSGTATNPYLIGTAGELGMVNWYPLDRCFKLTSDIDLSGIHWSVSVISVFTGCFDGDGHKLANMRISGGGCLGLFGYLGVSGQVRNLGLEGGSVSGVNLVGGLVGENDGSISNCYSTGDVNGTRYWVGGLVGYNVCGSVWNCYSTGSISGNWWVGGLVGKNGYWQNRGATITNCYSTGDVSGGEKVGGLVGENGGSVSNCYSSGDVGGDTKVGGLMGWNLYGSISNCFWDTDTQSHGVTESIGRNDGTVTNVEGLPTAEMQDINTYLNAGWDFNTPIWKFCSLPDYPSLWWEECPVLEPAELIAWLLEEVGGLELPGGIENGLEAKLNAALRALEDENENNDAAAINTLEAFINAVEAQRGKKIPEAEADALIAAAQEIIELLSDG